jgi:hypothetical protein
MMLYGTPTSLPTVKDAELGVKVIDGAGVVL